MCNLSFNAQKACAFWNMVWKFEAKSCQKQDLPKKNQILTKVKQNHL